MTPLNRADGLAGMCSLLDLDCTVVPSSSGAFAVKQFVSAHSDWDVAELLGGSDSEPAEAAELAAQLSRLSRAGAVLMTATWPPTSVSSPACPERSPRVTSPTVSLVRRHRRGSSWPPWTRSSRTCFWASSTPTTSPVP